jgi:hypothetical protein
MSNNRDNNSRKRDILLDLINETLGRVLKKGFFGKACFSVTIHDGSIQDVEKQETEKYR